MGQRFFLSLAVVMFCATPGMAFAHGPCDESLLPKQASAVHGKWDGKTIVLDTNVILNDPGAIYKYPGAHIIISGTVLEELNNKKNDPRLGRPSRTFTREVMKLIEGNPGAAKIPLAGGATLSIDHKNYSKMLNGTTLDKKLKDNELLGLSLAYIETLGKENVTVISDDLNLRIKASALGIEAHAFELDWPRAVAPKTENDALVYDISDADMERFLKTGTLVKPDDLKIAPNEFVAFKSPSHAADDKTVGRFRFNAEQPTSNVIHALPDFKKMGLPFEPLNLEQAMALDLLLDPTVDCVILEAKAGTGKTFLTMMAALRLKEKGTYSRVFVTKPTVYMGHNNPGALPGNIQQKYAEWMKPYLDNLSRLASAGKRDQFAPGGKKKEFKPVNSLPAGFELLPFEFVRGRSIPNSMMVIDEFQNTNLHEAKTILTRAGEGTKIVIMGDASQIDVSPNFLNATNNGLSVSAALLTSPDLPNEKRARVGRVRLRIGVRSPFADLASEVFENPIPQN